MAIFIFATVKTSNFTSKYHVANLGLLECLQRINIFKYMPVHICTLKCGLVDFITAMCLFFAVNSLLLFEFPQTILPSLSDDLTFYPSKSVRFRCIRYICKTRPRLASYCHDCRLNA